MGYKREQFEEKVDENLICSICHEVLLDPLQCKDGHPFCKECITEWLKTNQKCPMDNNPLQVDNLVPSLIAKNMIEEDEETADNDFEGVQQTCDWTGKLQSLEKHRETCPFQQIQCANENCETKIQRRDLEEHDEICEFKVLECEKCKEGFVRRVLQTHEDVDCPEGLVPCPNKCTSSQGQTNRIKRVDLSHHVSNICGETKVSCPFKSHGCSSQIERRNVDKHVQKNIAAHIILLAKENQALRDELNQVKAQLSSTNTYTWIIYDFPALCDKHPNGSGCRSPTFWLCGYKLYLAIYPNGINTDASGFISLYLNLHEEYSDTFTKVTNVPNSESTINFRLSTISQNHFTQDVSFVVTHVFKKQESWGWPKFIKKSKALSAAYYNSTNGSLNITCTILLDKP